MFSYKGTVIIRYELKAITGLRVGGSKENFEIGGLDNPVIKTLAEIENYDGEGNVLPEGAPYIPGSSLKGKMRSLLEWAKGRVDDMIKRAIHSAKNIVEEAGRACVCGKCEVCKVFGTGDAKTLDNLPLEELPGPPRLRVFDAYPTWKSLQMLKNILGENIFTEVKTENAINRLTSRANPRKVERVPAGVVFFGEMAFHLFAEQDPELLRVVFEGMRLLEDDYLGGYGSRGSGKVRFENLRVILRPKEYYFGEKNKEKPIIEKPTVQEILEDYETIKQKLGALFNA
ncbi:type III-A CRISPR-associated RAMP protein Csm3 [Thermocrinis jamiesonii]|uniref:type III-A CRISPR-associated RAMP protein Csm3 n=1 Tax=Thermocrinis jamiesonii TaxID=1302351 RepID=UPI0004959B40|nr:type III-A CRISPR-associated RAMP protein Csm3 [Thermocrinis jamiesonii]